jgi:predicted MFS family arabinose efflux permease
LKPVTALHWEGSISVSYLLLAQGPIFVALALSFHLDLVLLGIAAAFPMAFQVFQLLTPVLVRPGARLKVLLAVFNALRFVWSALIVLALRGMSGPAAFIVVFAVAQAANALAANVWLMLVQRIVPDPLRGRFLARRNVYISVLTILLVPIYSALLARLPEPMGVAMVIALSLFGTLLSILFVLPLPDYRRRAQERGALLEPLRNRNFRRLAVAHAYWSFAILLTAPFFSYHQIENIGIPLTAISAQTSALGLLSIVFYRLWGGLTDRLGIKSITVAGIVIVSLTPWFWLLMVDGLWPLAMVFDVINGSFGWAAVNIIILAFPLEAGRRDAPQYFGVYFALGGIGGLAGSVAGGYVAELFHHIDVFVAGHHIYGLQLFLLLGSLLRLAAIPLFLRVQTAKYVSLPTVALNVLSVVARRSPARLFENSRPGSADVPSESPDAP